MGSWFSSLKAVYAPLMFHPPTCSYEKDLPGLQFVEYPSGSRLQRIPIAVIQRDSPITVLYSHGNACDMGHMIPFMTQFARTLDVSVWLYDYPGYGLAEGNAPTESTICEAIEQVYQHYASQAKPSDRLVIMGTSIGSGPSCYLASTLDESQYSGLLLECPLASAFGAISECSAETSSSLDAFPNYVWAPKVCQPVMILHGTADEVIPHAQAEKLAAALGKHLYQFWSVEGAGHNNLFHKVGFADYYGRLSKFLDDVNKCL